MKNECLHEFDKWSEIEYSYMWHDEKKMDFTEKRYFQKRYCKKCNLGEFRNLLLDNSEREG